MTTYYIYLHYRPDGTPFYVGKGCDKWYKRSHCFTGRSKYHKNIVAKYGKENIKIQVFPCESENHAFEEEIRTIAKLRSEGYCLCNLTNGGEGTSGAATSQEVRANRAEITKKTWTGRKHKPESILKMTASRTGKKQTDSHRDAIRKAHIGKTASEETRAKLSEHAKKRTFSEETRKKMSDAQKRRHEK